MINRYPSRHRAVVRNRNLLSGQRKQCASGSWQGIADVAVIKILIRQKDHQAGAVPPLRGAAADFYGLAVFCNNLEFLSCCRRLEEMKCRLHDLRAEKFPPPSLFETPFQIVPNGWAAHLDRGRDAADYTLIADAVFTPALSMACVL